jgi:hypothetical protein
MLQDEFWHLYVSLPWVLLAVAVFVILFFVTAPYGRHARRKTGPTINNGLAWLLMEAPAPVVSSRYVEAVNAAAETGGVPVRIILVPHPIWGEPTSVLRQYLEGSDPVSGKPVVEEFVDALTKPLTDEEKRTGIIERPVPRLLEPDTPENLERLFLEKGWTDVLPIVLPT